MGVSLLSYRDEYGIGERSIGKYIRYSFEGYTRVGYLGTPHYILGTLTNTFGLFTGYWYIIPGILYYCTWFIS